MNPNEIQNWVSIKQFQRNIYEFLDQLPIVLTKHGKPFAFLAEYSKKAKIKVDYKNDEDSRKKNKPIIAIKPLEEIIPKIQEKKKVDVCEHGRMKGLCEHGCK